MREPRAGCPAGTYEDMSQNAACAGRETGALRVWGRPELLAVGQLEGGALGKCSSRRQGSNRRGGWLRQ